MALKDAMQEISLEEQNLEDEATFSIENNRNCPKNDFRCKVRTDNGDALDECIGARISKEFVVIGAALSTDYNAILDKQWMKGAKALAGIAASLTLIYASCIANPNQKI
ncbi:hypothetical protein [Alkalicoccobacillus plakortidis]|uniref:Uncharacterized protein n=1 Tax=Alkalicoccobacillus plakortidis TaxID=444060 RepID=A0ABT0XPS3_9BACI|nr:hypothetical protein [Alkalicoccobacillus plakortidis]MCM2677914.1 hypothetical protein [Alkalicoccobacillus plakortidis]